MNEGVQGREAFEAFVADLDAIAQLGNEALGGVGVFGEIDDVAANRDLSERLEHGVRNVVRLDGGIEAEQDGFAVAIALLIDFTNLALNRFVGFEQLGLINKRNQDDTFPRSTGAFLVDHQLSREVLGERRAGRSQEVPVGLGHGTVAHGREDGEQLLMGKEGLTELELDLVSDSGEIDEIGCERSVVVREEPLPRRRALEIVFENP